MCVLKTDELPAYSSTSNCGVVKKEPMGCDAQLAAGDFFCGENVREIFLYIHGFCSWRMSSYG